jgi:hypothetical protein
MPTKLSVVPDRPSFMDVRADVSQEVAPMSAMAAAPGYRVSPARRADVGHPGSVRLTRRGRLVVLALMLGGIFLALTFLGGHSAATDEAGAPVETRTVVVGEGDTLWGIASEVAEPGEVREVIHHIQELNALPSAALMRGQELAVPVG